MQITEYVPGTPNWIDLGSPNPDESVAFYGALFGWDAGEASEEFGGYRMFFLHGKSVAGLGPQQRADVPPFWSSYVSVVDAAAAATAVEAAGGKVLVSPMTIPEAGTMAVFSDPEGSQFSVWHADQHIGSELANEPGALTWNELLTRDPEGAKQFYGAVFGWESEAMPTSRVDYTVFKIGDNMVGGMMPMGNDFPPQMPSAWMIYIAVEDVDATAAQAVELGGNVNMPPMDIEQGRIAVLGDPHGAVFCVIKMD